MTIPPPIRRTAFAAAILLTAATVAPVPGQEIIVSGTSNWDYLHPTNGVDPAMTDPDFATTWMLYTGYDGPAFVTGRPGPLSYGGIFYFSAANGLDGGSFIGAGGTATAPPSGQRYSAYFKKEFTAAQNYAEAHALVLADDGAIIYLNGIEIARVNMSNTSGDAYDMLADDVDETETVLVDANLGPIAAGDHVLAVSLHNAAADSSDLGLYLELLGEKPPSPPMLRTELGGVFTDVQWLDGFTGWTNLARYNFLLNGAAAGTVHTIQSSSVDLSLAGEVHFSMQIYCYETSGGSNFEAADEFGARLLVTFDDDTATEIPLIPDALDLDVNGVLSGDEFNPAGIPPAEATLLARELTAVIPANVKSAVLQVSGSNDSTSTSETLSFGAALISDVPPGSDGDGDGISREAEMFAGTDPEDPLDTVAMTGVELAFDTTAAAWDLDLTMNVKAGKIYAVESSPDGLAGWTFYAAFTSNFTGPGFFPSIDLGPALDTAAFFRIRCIP